MFASNRRPTLAAGVILALVLLATLALTAQSIRAARAQRRVAAALLTNFADQAAWNFGARIEARLYTGMGLTFRNVRLGVTEPLAQGPSALRSALDIARRCQCGMVLEPRWTFAFDLRDGEFIADSAVPTASRDALTDRLRSFASTIYQDRWDGALVLVPTRPHPDLVILTVRKDSAGRPARVYGYAAHERSVRADLFEFVVARFALVPSVHDLPNDSLLVVSVKDSTGAEHFRSGADVSLADGTILSGRYAGSFQIHVAIRPTALRHLLPGIAISASIAPIVGLAVTATVLILAAGVLLQRASALAEARANFLSGVSHELKTPLTQILLYGQTMMLGRLRETDDYRKEARVVVDEAQHLLGLIDNVLHAARLGHAALPLEPRDVVLADSLASVVATLRTRAELQGVELAVTIDPAARAVVDPAALTGVLRNLVDNAFKYGNGTLIEVSVGPAGRDIAIVVEDGGPGVPAAARRRIWRPFTRLARHSSAGGSGLGLAVVDDLVRRHGGTVSVTTGNRGGARFVVRVPNRPPTG